jgi:hypothetical protein
MLTFETRAFTECIPQKEVFINRRLATVLKVLMLIYGLGLGE